jgi:hypothetical protein
MPLLQRFRTRNSFVVLKHLLPFDFPLFLVQWNVYINLIARPNIMETESLKIH